jgi:hypothetical protein
MIHTDLLKPIAKGNYIASSSRIQVWKHGERLLENAVNLRAHVVRIAVVPQVPNLLMNPPNIIVAHHHLVCGGFEVGVPTVPNDIFRESRNTIIADMVLTAGKAYDIKPAGTKCSRMGLHVPIAWRDNGPPQNIRGGLWGREDAGWVVSKWPGACGSLLGPDAARWVVLMHLGAGESPLCPEANRWVVLLHPGAGKSLSRPEA